MPIVYETPREFNQLSAAPAPERADPTLGETVSSAFAMENDVAALMEYSEHPFKNEGFRSQFNVRKEVESFDKENKTSFFEQYPDAFLGVESRDEMLYKINKITKENTDRDVINRAGWTGFAASITAGLASPLSFVPMVGGATRLRQAAKLAAIGFATGAVEEGILQGTHETRTAEESIMAIASSTALMGILGGIAPALKPEVKAAFENQLTKAAEDIGRPQSVGAAINEDVSWKDVDVGGLADGAKRASRIINKTGVLTNPVTQNIDQTDLPFWRTFTQQMDDAGLRMEGNEDGIAAAPGGTLSNRVGSIYGSYLNNTTEQFDQIYARYAFDGTVPSVAPNLRASIRGALNPTKLSKSEFNIEVSRAIRDELAHQIPEVAEAAKLIAKNIFEPILERAKAAGIFTGDVKVVGDRAYVHRIYNTTAIQAKTAKFINILAEHEEAKYVAEFKKDLEKLYAKQTKATEAAEDIQRPGDEAEQLIAKFRQDLDELNKNVPDDLAITEETARDLRALARGEQDPVKRQKFLSDARDMDKLGGQELQNVKGLRAHYRRRLRNLTQTRALLDAKRARKLELIERIDEQNISALHRVAKKAQSILGQLGKISDEKLDSEISKFKTEFERVGRLYDKGEEKLVELGETPEANRTADLQEKRFERLQAVSEKLEQAENFDRNAARAAIQEGLDVLIERVNEINSRRAVRQAKLIEEQAQLKPEVYAAKLKEMNAVPGNLANEFAVRWGDRGAMNIDLKKGTAFFRETARERATQVKDKIVGTYLRLPAMDILSQERTAELARVLDIPSSQIEEFLENDISKIVRTYVRTMGPDIELYNKFGSMDWHKIIEPAVDELNAKIDEIANDAKLSDKQKEKKTAKLNADFALYKKNGLAMIERLRGIRGAPSDPDAFAFRAAQTVMNLNVARSMGGVVIASLPDLGQPVLKYGLTRTFRDGFLPLINNFKAFKLNAREAKLANAANDVTSHSRAMAIRDVLDDMQRGSKFEKGLEWASNKMGLLALFDYWTQGMKMFTGSIANAKMMDALASFHEAGGTMTAKQAGAYLAEMNIGGKEAAAIWKEVVENGGGAKIDGVWWPNTESWQSQAAKDAYRQGLYREVNRTIIQPGLEKPLLSDENTLGRMLYQFKSFGLSATPKVVLAGLQQKDAAVLSGSLASLGLGAMGYYLWAVAAGGQAYNDMMNAGIDKWADEAINRSGLVGGLSEVQRVAQNIPLISDYVSFSGKKSTRRPGDNLVEALLGPSFDFGQSAAQVVGGLKEPTQSTLHEFRKLLPFQNVFYLRQAIDAVEASAGSNLPQRRGQ